ncbi:MAG: hypothetical protein F6K40_25810, partial [Okeania sp. SIO3I5]|uniref:Calx-beta domain-containing protein n=1 Tax=Okeania sp. SIO3I5 TaxID=2607805 RepID=UPI0013BC354E
PSDSSKGSFSTPEAGTFYLGVSSSVNGVYDSNAEGSGSGDGNSYTGSYDLTIETTTEENMTLNPGDIAFVQYNATNPDNFKFVALVDIPASEEIKFTDNGWLGDNSGFRTGEGIITWTAPVGGISAGTVVEITNTSASEGTTSGSLTLSTDGDQILAYQGTNTFIAALNNEGAATWQADATDPQTSALPQGLTNGTDAVAISEIDNAVYTGITTGDKATLLAALNNKDNWTGSNSSNQTFSGTFSIDAGGGGTTLAIAATDAEKAEGDSGTTAFTFTVTRSGDTSGVTTVDYATLDGLAVAGDDYTSSSGNLTFAAGETSKTITVDVIGDTEVETDEGFTVSLFNASGGATISTADADGTIQNDDTPPPPTLAIAATDAEKAEGDSGTTAFTFTVTRSGDTSGVTTVDYATLDGLAVAGDDYTSSSGNLTFAAGETSKTITVDVIGDTEVETDEGFTVSLFNASGGATISTADADGTIQNDDTPPPPTLAIAATDAEKAEGDSGTTAFTFTVTRSGDT